MLLYLYLDGTKMITFLLACLYVLCQMPATDTAGIALFFPPFLPFLFFSRGSETRFVIQVIVP